MPRCCVVNCTTNTGHKFPKHKKTKTIWYRAINRLHFKPSNNSIVCSKHFQASDFIETGYHSGLKNTRKILKKGAVPSQLLGKPIKPLILSQRQQRLDNRIKNSLQTNFNELDDNMPNNEIDIENVEQEVEVCTDNSDIKEAEKEAVAVADVGVQTCGINSILSVAKFVHNNDVLHYYTGLENYKKFQFVLQTLGPNRFKFNYKRGRNYSLSLEDQFFLTLIKLRRNTPDFELGTLFDVSTSTASNIFISWINFMSKQWNELDLWPSQKLVRYYMPESFKISFPSTRVIIDGTEFPIVKPVEPICQQATFSSYKNRNTLKVIVGGTPGGLISYCSEAYGGATSDRQIVERCSLRDICKSGDSILADRGFNVQDIFASKNVTVNAPSFLRGKSQLPGLVVLNDRKIANKRVHIERLIGMTKTYNILCQPLNKNYFTIGSDIYFVCTMLCNFRSGIMNIDN